jgi:hypothetical protein
MRPSTGASNPAASNSDMNDFNRAIALQATPQQIAQFQQLTKSTAAAMTPGAPTLNLPRVRAMANRGRTGEVALCFTMPSTWRPTN